MPHYMEVSPFIAACPDDETRIVDLDDGALVKDVIKEFAKLLNLKANRLRLVKDVGEDLYVLLNNHEVPPERAFMKGVKTLAGVPGNIAVRMPEKPKTFTPAVAHALQQDTIDAYTNELLQLQIKNLQKQCLDGWTKNKQVKPADFNKGLRDLLQPYQAEFFPKYGFEAVSKDMVQIQTIFDTQFADDPLAVENTAKVNAMIGTDFSWLPTEFNFAVPGAPAEVDPQSGMGGE